MDHLRDGLIKNAGLTLGQLISALENQPRENKVFFDFCSNSPSRFSSYRGYYSCLALGYMNGDGPDVDTFLGQCRWTVGNTFTGYKGGEFLMEKKTAIWVANFGLLSNTIISDVSRYKEKTILHTMFDPS